MYGAGCGEHLPGTGLALGPENVMADQTRPLLLSYWGVLGGMLVPSPILTCSDSVILENEHKLCSVIRI